MAIVTRSKINTDRNYMHVNNINVTNVKFFFVKLSEKTQIIRTIY